MVTTTKRKRSGKRACVKLSHKTMGHVDQINQRTNLPLCKIVEASIQHFNGLSAREQVDFLRKTVVTESPSPPRG